MLENSSYQIVEAALVQANFNLSITCLELLLCAGNSSRLQIWLITTRIPQLTTLQYICLPRSSVWLLVAWLRYSSKCCKRHIHIGHIDISTSCTIQEWNRGHAHHHTMLSGYQWLTQFCRAVPSGTCGSLLEEGQVRNQDWSRSTSLLGCSVGVPVCWDSWASRQCSQGQQEDKNSTQTHSACSQKWWGAE